MTSPPSSMAAVMHLEAAGATRFEYHRATAQKGRTFGGELFGQAVVAAYRTVQDSLRIHSAHANFLRAGDTTEPVSYEVEVVRDGVSFSTRRVEAHQAGAVLMDLTASFHKPAAVGFAHQWERVDPPAPDGLLSAEQTMAGEPILARWLYRVLDSRPIEMRFAAPPVRVFAARGQAADPRQGFWVRALPAFPADLRLRTGALAYLSDLLLMSSALGPHKMTIGDPALTSATLDHAMWFHADCAIDDWVWYEQEGLWTGAGLSLSRGAMYDSRGVLLASTMQQGLLRVRRDG